MIKHAIFLVLTLMLVQVSIVKSDLSCSKLQAFCKPNKKHVLCIGEAKNSCEKPSDKGDGLTPAEIKVIVDKHNELRDKVASGNEKRGLNKKSQPPAKNLKHLEWDEKLAKVAQHWAYQCTLSHDDCSNIDKDAVGQNIAMISLRDNVVEAGVLKWYDEVENFDPALISKFVFHENTGHYTQMVWAATKKIGCGAVKYHKKKFEWIYLVCNYAPAGNMDGAKMYEE